MDDESRYRSLLYEHFKNMEQHSPTRESIKNLAMRISESNNDISEENNNKAKLWNLYHIISNVTTIVLSAIAGATIISNINSFYTGVGAIIASILTGLYTFLKPYDRVRSYRNLATKHMELSKRAQYFSEIKCIDEEMPISMLIREFEELMEEDVGVMRVTTDVLNELKARW